MTYTLKTVKPHPASEPVGEAINAARWKNLIFTKGGAFFHGTRIYKSREAAEKIARQPVPDFAVIETMEGSQISAREFSHAIPIPWDDQ